MSGDLTALAGDEALTDKIATPFTFTVADAGRGGFSISGAVVDGKPQTIVWSGGRPLPVSGACQLDVAEAKLDLTTSGATFALDGAVRALTAGACSFGSSVAVGSGGLASPQDSVSFRLPQDATFEPTGQTKVTVGPTRHFEGHRGSASVRGAFAVSTTTDDWRASQVALGNGTWFADVTKTANGSLHLEAQFEGDLTITRG